MNTEIFRLEPKSLWENFYSLTQIPRPSKNEDKVVQFLKNYGEQAGLETIVDSVGNVIIRKPATAGMENHKGIILQSHVDMVPQKNSDKKHDFEKDPIEAYIDGDWVKANGTTLGADNGIGVAAAMSVLKSKDITHGPIEALFTIDEETGMTGVLNLKNDVLKGDILLNLDSEDEGELYIGCAGGANTNITFDYTAKEVPVGYKGVKISVTGLKGGHSGIDIILDRGNANKILNVVLQKGINVANTLIANIDGGSLRNAIPREAFATVAIPAEAKEEFYNIVAETEASFKEELANTDAGLQITLSDVSTPEKYIDNSVVEKLLKAVEACPNGVIARVANMDDVIETSSNLAIIKTENNQILISSLQRSSVEKSKEKLCEEIKTVFEKAGGKVVHSGDYPGWKPNLDSPILNTMQSVYNTKYGKVPEIKVIHAGLECGLLGGIYPNLDMISFGPTIRFPHSPDEKVNIESIKKFWGFLVETLKNVSEKL